MKNGRLREIADFLNSLDEPYVVCIVILSIVACVCIPTMTVALIFPKPQLKQDTVQVEHTQQEVVQHEIVQVEKPKEIIRYVPIQTDNPEEVKSNNDKKDAPIWNNYFIFLIVILSMFLIGKEMLRE